MELVDVIQAGGPGEDGAFGSGLGDRAPGRPLLPGLVFPIRWGSE